MARLIGNVDATGSLTTPNATIDTSYTKLWLDGSDLTDKSGTNTLTVTGVTSSTAHSKFGGSSLFFDGTDDKIIFSNTNGSLQLNGSFTVEFWARWDGGSGYNSLVAFGDPANSYIALLVATHDNNWKLWMANAANSGFNPSAQGFGAASANTWQHISINCDANANSVECYVDGVRGFSGQGNNNSYSSSDSYSLSGRSVGQRYGGYVDDFFVLNGYKLRTGAASFTVPTTPFSGGIETTTNDTRTFSSVWNLNSAVVAENFKAGTWPGPPVTNSTVTVQVFGAGGAGGAQNAGGAGGDGGIVKASKSIAIGTVLKIVVGNGGVGWAQANTGLLQGNTSDAMRGGDIFSDVSNQTGGQGGSGSGVFVTSVAHGNAQVVAGGGGGGAGNASGAGGDSHSGTGASDSLNGSDGTGNSSYRGQGATTTSGGSANGNGSGAGAALLGGYSGTSSSTAGGGPYNSGGSGGGGYYGGSGAGHGDSASHNGGGGAGSGYVDSTWTRLSATGMTPKAGSSNASDNPADGADGAIIVTDGAGTTTYSTPGTYDHTVS